MIENIIEDSLNLLDRNETYKAIEFMSLFSYIQEYRMISIGFPRQIGKTNYIIDKLNSNQDSFLFYKARYFNNSEHRGKLPLERSLTTLDEVTIINNKIFYNSYLSQILNSRIIYFDEIKIEECLKTLEILCKIIPMNPNVKILHLWTPH